MHLRFYTDRLGDDLAVRGIANEVLFFAKGEENNLCALNFRVVLSYCYRNNISSFRMVKMLPAVEHENYTEVFKGVPAPG